MVSNSARSGKMMINKQSLTLKIIAPDFCKYFVLSPFMVLSKTKYLPFKD